MHDWLKKIKGMDNAHCFPLPCLNESQINPSKMNLFDNYASIASKDLKVGMMSIVFNFPFKVPPAMDSLHGHWFVLTLLMLRLLCLRHKNSKLFENHLNPIILVFIRKLSSSTFR